MTIETEKIRYPKYSLRCWTHSTIHCFEQNCKCAGCIYENAMESQKCKGKIAVLLLIELYGEPTKKQLDRYYEIEEKLKWNYHE